MAELDQSEKKRYYARENELNAMAAGRTGMISALGRDFFDKEEDLSSRAAHANVDRADGDDLANPNMNNQSSQGTSKFRAEEGEQQQRYSNEGMDSRGSPGNPYGDDVGRTIEEQPNGEATISRYLVG